MESRVNGSGVAGAEVQIDGAKQPRHHRARQREPDQPDPQRPDEHPAGGRATPSGNPVDHLSRPTTCRRSTSESDRRHADRDRRIGQPDRPRRPPRPRSRRSATPPRRPRPAVDDDRRTGHRRRAATTAGDGDTAGRLRAPQNAAVAPAPRRRRGQRDATATDGHAAGHRIRRDPGHRRAGIAPTPRRPATDAATTGTAAAAPAWPAGSNPDNPTQPLGTDQAAWTAWETAATTALPTLQLRRPGALPRAGRPEQAADRLRRRRHRDLPAGHDADRRHPDRAPRPPGQSTPGRRLGRQPDLQVRRLRDLVVLHRREHRHADRDDPGRPGHLRAADQRPDHHPDDRDLRLVHPGHRPRRWPTR